MTVGELKEALKKFPDNMEVITKKERCKAASLGKGSSYAAPLGKEEGFGNAGEIFAVKLDSYSFFGKNIPCVLLTDSCGDENEEEKDLEQLTNWLNTGETKKPEAPEKPAPKINAAELWGDYDDEDD